MIKKRFVIFGIGIVLAVLVATAATVWFEQEETSPGPSIVPPSEGVYGAATFVLNTTFPEASDSYLAYKVINPEVTSDYVEDIGRKFGLTGKAEPYQEDKIRLVDVTKDERERLSVKVNSGAIRYQIDGKFYPTHVESQPLLPSEEEAKRIAVEYLSSRDLLPEDAEIKSVRVNQQCGNLTVTYDLTLAVRFSRNFNGIPIYGHDGLSVIIGNNSEVVGMTMNLRDVEPYKNVKIKTPEQAYEELIAGKSRVQPPLETILNRVTINEISIGYWMEPGFKKQEFVLPVYVFKGTCTDFGGRKTSFRDFVSTVRADEGLVMQTPTPTPMHSPHAVEVPVSVNAPESVPETFGVTIDVENVIDMNGGQFDLSFDSSVVNVTDVNAGNISGTTIPTESWQFIDSDTIRVQFKLPGNDGVSGSGYVAEIDFETIGSQGDTIVLDISDGLLSDIEAGKILATWTDDDVAIGVPVTVNAPESVSDTFDVTIDVKGIADVNSGQFDLSFDSSVVNVTGVSAGNIGGTTIPIVGWGFMDADTVRVLFKLDGIDCVSGSGYVARINFETKGSKGDSCVLGMSKVMLVDTEAGEIPATWTDGEVTV